MSRDTGPCPDRYRDRFVRETAERMRFLMGLSDRYREPARLIEELKQALCACGGRPARG